MWVTPKASIQRLSWSAQLEPLAQSHWNIWARLGVVWHTEECQPMTPKAIASQLERLLARAAAQNDDLATATALLLGIHGSVSLPAGEVR